MKPQHFSFTTQSVNGTTTTANVFIHGYSAGHNFSDRALLISQIPQALNTDINLLAFWESSHFGSFGKLSRNVIYGASRLHPAATVAAFAGDRAVHFAMARKRANVAGEALLEELGEYLLEHYPYVTHVNLVGHSLGGRVVISALRKLVQNHDACDLIINDVLLMAAAVEVSAHEAQALNDTAERVINAYSKSDAVLLLNADEKCMGRHEVAPFDNVEMIKFGHLDYWPKLHDVLVRTQFAGFNGQQLGQPQQQDSTSYDVLLHGLLQRAPKDVLAQGIKHLKTSSWTKIDEKQPLHSFIQEIQHLGGNCMVNFVRGRGITYAMLLDMLVEHFGLCNERQKCGAVVELEALLIRQVFDNAFPEGHAFSFSPINAVKAMPSNTYFSHVDALAERLTLASYVKAPLPSTEVETSKTMAASGEMFNVTQLASWNMLPTLPGLLGKRINGRWMTNFKTALKPGYSALIPTVAVVFFARVHWGNERGFKQ
ncbi:conserved hypothetical protein [Pseudomonas sp. 8Z]|uniref:DUF726 domain-containing protein n=1 Tax=Pseudomonas sp. 8Z TaxID=2653166 RepID=UPI0012F1CE8B|nr:DUF726 domain-containing protein [Pseudomonas sp. 8Z]VXC97625.1 conserved hypothetical protein [Pseudomonas sp. 8Z]